VPQHLLEHHPRVQRDLLILVPRERCEDDVRFPREVLHRRPSRANLAPQQVIENLDHVLPRLELESRDVRDEQEQQVRVVRLLRQLRDKLWGWF
jgi:hypothetical protein